MDAILQSRIPYDVFATRSLPGVQRLEMADWLDVGDAYGGQMRERARLLGAHRGDVVMLEDTARDAAQELLDIVLDDLAQRAGFGVADSVACPDGRFVAINRDDPLGTLGHLVQEDFCILQKRGDEHALSGAVLCFPASWTLAEKFARPLGAIHTPVAEYNADIAARVQRLFDGVQVGRAMWRFNVLWYADATLHQPRGFQDRREREEPGEAAFLRSERQCILRLPETQAVVFSIHTYVMARGAVCAKVQA